MMAQILNLHTHLIGGPFYIQEGQDGVDETFDIKGYVSGCVFLCTRYWDDRDEAFELAKLFTFVLNAYLYNWKADRMIHRNLIEAFRKRYPGPYHYRFDKNTFYGSHLVIDQSREEVIHEEYGDPDCESYRNTITLIYALNHHVKLAGSDSPTRNNHL